MTFDSIKVRKLKVLVLLERNDNVIVAPPPLNINYITLQSKLELIKKNNKIFTYKLYSLDSYNRCYCVELNS